MEKEGETTPLVTATIVSTISQRKEAALDEFIRENEKWVKNLEETIYYNLVELIEDYNKYANCAGEASITTALGNPIGTCARNMVAIESYLQSLKGEKLTDWFPENELDRFATTSLKIEFDFKRKELLLTVTVDDMKVCCFRRWS
jgi:hypothetical protein